jgi:hypothetical protein
MSPLNRLAPFVDAICLFSLVAGMAEHSGCGVLWFSVRRRKFRLLQH